MERFKSSPSLPGIYSPFCSSKLFDLLTKSEYVHMRFHTILMNNFDCADEEEAGGRSDRDRSPTPSIDTQNVHPRSTRTAARKRPSSSQTVSNR